MSLTNPSLVDVVKKQYFYKLKAYTPVFFNLVFIQVLAILFSFNGVGMSGASSDNIEMSVHYYSGDIVVIFTFIWAFVTAFNVTTKVNRDIDFSFVTNRLSSNLSNALFLITVGFLGAILAILSTNLLVIIFYYFSDQQFLNSQTVMSNPKEFLIGITSTSFYVFLFCALGYFAGTLVQIHKVFAFILPASFFGMLILDEGLGEAKIVSFVFEFFFKESSLIMFITKVIVMVCLLFASAFAFSNRMEVKQ